MSSREQHSILSPAESIRPAVHTASVNGQGVDLRDFDAATCIYAVGAIAGSGNVTVKLQESDDNSSFSDVAADDLQGEFPAALLTNTVGRVGYRGVKRYIRAVGTLNSGTSVAYSAVIVRGEPHSTVGL